MLNIISMEIKVKTAMACHFTVYQVKWTGSINILVGREAEKDKISLCKLEAWEPWEGVEGEERGSNGVEKKCRAQYIYI